MLSALKYLLVLWFIFLVTFLKGQNTLFKFDHLTVNNGLPQNSVYSIVKDKYGFMWFSTWGGAVRYDGYNLKVFRANENDTTALSDNRINTIVTDSLQNIWIQTGDPRYLYKYNYESENFSRIQSNLISPFVKRKIKNWEKEPFPSVRNGQYMWVSNHHELRQINLTTGHSTIYTADITNPFSLSDNIVNFMYLDDADNLWIGTQNGGINHANLNIKPFSYYHSDKNGNGLVDNVVRAVCKDRTGRIWVGSENKGITIIDRDPKKKQYTYFAEKEEHTQRIRSIMCDSNGQIWIGTKGGLLSYNAGTNTFKNCSAGICEPNVFAIAEDHEGMFWVGTFNGLAIYDRATNHFECLGASLTGGKQIRNILEDRKHNLWVATEDGGVARLERTMNRKQRFKSTLFIHKEGNENSLINNHTFSLAEDKLGMIWIATNSGLSRLNPADNTFRHFTSRNGLPDDIIMSVLYDEKESIWISHKKGLSRINIRTFEIQNFNMYDGLQGNEFTQSACFRDPSTGEMFFGGTNGLNSFFPDSITTNRTKPRVVFTQLRVMDQLVQPGTEVDGTIILKKSLLCTDEIMLPWSAKSFSIEYAALHYANPLGNKYKYKLEGYDRQWISSDALVRTATYSHLSFGTYFLKVYAANSDGAWSDTPATLRITILPPWWLSGWAIAVYAILCLLIGWFVFKYIHNRIEYRKNEEIHQAKFKFFTEISHEFRTPLTLIIDPLEKIIQEDLPKETVKQYNALMHRNAKQLLLLINQLLDFRKLEAGHLNLNLQSSDILLLVRSTASSFETAAEKRNIDFRIHSSISELVMDVDIPKVNMILNNLLSNAFKFTPNGGNIDVSIDMADDEKNTIMISVQDTGVGIQKTELSRIFDIFYQSTNAISHREGSGIGLALTKELVKLHGGKITVESELDKGSCFKVFFPINKKSDTSSADPAKEALEIKENLLNEKYIPRDRSLSSSNLPLVLVVDDNADIRNYIELNFNHSFRIVLASNGTEGFRQAAEVIPDIVISDIMMPGMDGLELCRLLKTDERTSHIPVILLTARQSDEAKKEGYETGADAYVTKPFNSNVLEAQIRNLLDQRQRLRELFSKGSVMELKKIAINITDEAFLNKVTRLVEENLENENFDMDVLAGKLKMSRSQFYKKIKALTNKSLQDFVTAIRMNRALEYLLSGEYNVSEVSYKVGYSLPTNFTRTFIKHFGSSPKKYIGTLKNQDPD